MTREMLEANEADLQRAKAAGFCDIVVSYERFGDLLTIARAVVEWRDAEKRMRGKLAEHHDGKCTLADCAPARTAAGAAEDNLRRVADATARGGDGEGR